MDNNKECRHATVHRMTRWPNWKDSRLPGTYMVTIKANGGQPLFGSLAGSASAVYAWIKAHPQQTQQANADSLYYRHALLGTIAMPFVQKETASRTQGTTQGTTQAVETAAHKDSGKKTPPSSYGEKGQSAPLSSCDGVSTPSSTTGLHGKARTHFPLEALRQPSSPHIVLSPLGRKVKECLERMPEVVPQVHLVCYAIMPNHLHFIIAVRETLDKAVGSVIRSFMGTTSHCFHKMAKAGEICLSTTSAAITQDTGAEKPSLWTKGYCIGVCQTEQRLHTCIGYVLENPFLCMLEKEHSSLMGRTVCLDIAGRTYNSYGNILLLKEPERIQVFCHRRHPDTREPYEQTQDFRNEKAALLEASANGAVIVTPGISPGETDIMWAVLKSGGSVINIQQKTEDTQKWHPEKERRLYCSRGQMLVLAASDMPHETFRDWQGDVIPSDTRYARFHLLNEVAREICAEGTEHRCAIKKGRP